MIDLTTRNSRPTTSGSHGESGKTPRSLLHHTNPTGLTTNNPLPATALHMILPQNHSRHFPPPILHHHAKSRRNLPILGTTIPQPPSMSLQDMLINLQEGSKRNGSEESSSASATQSACQQHQKFHLTRNHDQERQWRLWNSTVLLRHCKRWTLEFQPRLPGKQSTSFSAQIFFLILTWRSLTSLSYLPPTCLHSSFHFQSPVTSKRHLLSKITKTSPGRFSMERRSEPLRQSCWKVRSDQQTGLTTKTTPDVTCPPLVLFSSAERLQIATLFLIGRQRNLWIRSKRKGKDSKTSLSGRCTEVHANILLSKLVEMKWHSSPWLKRSGNNVGEIHDCP